LGLVNPDLFYLVGALCIPDNVRNLFYLRCKIGLK
jgi:hypothetical protein